MPFGMVKVFGQNLGARLEYFSGSMRTSPALLLEIFSCVVGWHRGKSSLYCMQVIESCLQCPSFITVVRSQSDFTEDIVPNTYVPVGAGAKLEKDRDTLLDDELISSGTGRKLRYKNVRSGFL